MIDRETINRFIRIFALIICVIVLIIFIRLSLAKYRSDANFKRDFDVAFFLVENSLVTEHVAISNIEPSDNQYEFSFTIANFNEEKRAEVTIEYEIQIVATTNMPLEYSLKKNGTACNTEEIEIVKDSDGTYYKKLVALNNATNAFELEHTANKQDTLTLCVNFPMGQENYLFADLVEDIQITVSAKQKL